MPIQLDPNVVTSSNVVIPEVDLQPADLDAMIQLLESAGGVSCPSFPFTSANLQSFTIQRKNDGVVDGNGNSLLYFAVNICPVRQ